MSSDYCTCIVKLIQQVIMESQNDHDQPEVTLENEVELRAVKSMSSHQSRTQASMDMDVLDLEKEYEKQNAINIDRNKFFEAISKFKHSKMVGLILYILLILFVIFIMCITLMYGIGQLYSVSFSNVWCQKSYTINEIYQINSKNNKAKGSEFTCLQTDAIVDYEKLFANDPSDTYISQYDTRNESRNIIFCIFYQIATISFAFILIKNVVAMCHKTTNPNATIATQNAETTNKTSCYKGFCDNFAVICVTWLSVDTPTWIALKLLSETMEIFVQILVLFDYGGTSFVNIIVGVNDSDITAQLPIYVKIFAFIIAINGITTGIFWCLYAIFPHIIYGHSFNYALFVFDGLFDAIYSIYPIIIAGGFDLNLNFLIYKIGILQHENIIQFIGAYVPLLLLIRKSDAALIRIGRIIQGKKIGDEYAISTSNLMRNDAKKTNNNKATEQNNIRLSHGLSVDITTPNGMNITKALFLDHRSKFEKRMSDEFSRKSVTDHNNPAAVDWKEHNKRVTKNMLKRLCIVFIAIFVVWDCQT